jgi:hypothetical protein
MAASDTVLAKTSTFVKAAPFSRRYWYTGTSLSANSGTVSSTF